MPILGGKEEGNNMFRPYLAEGFKLFLLTSVRRERTWMSWMSWIFVFLKYSKC